MSDVSAFFLRPDIVVVLAASFQIIGYLLRTQLYLRLLLLVGTILDIFYYLTAAEAPLWTAVGTSSALALANLIGLVMLMLSRTRFLIAGAQIRLYEMIGKIEPGEFRSLMRQGIIRTVTKDRVLTIEGEVPEALYYILAGSAKVSKGTGEFTISPQSFIGEVSIMLDMPASATVTISKGAEIVEWPRDKLIPAMQRDNKLNIALEALIARDMAKKVSAGVQREGAGSS